MYISRFMIIILFLYLSSSIISCENFQQSKDSSIPINMLRKDFWIDSNYACCSPYLIQVLLPDDYFKSDTTTYPVVYQLDADLCFGVLTDRSHFISHSRQNSIMVGVSYKSTEAWVNNRRKDFLPHPDANGIPGDENFRLFLELELIPAIESKFRSRKHSNTLVGLSWSGLFTLNTLLKKNTLFKNYVVGGWVPEDHWLREMSKTDLPHLTNLYVAVGEHENSKKLEEQATHIDKIGINNLLFKWEILAGRGHEYSAFVDAINRGLNYSFAKKSSADEMIKEIKRSSVNYSIKKYNQWKKYSPDQFDFNPTELIRVSDFLEKQGLHVENKKIEKILAENHPKQKVTIIAKPYELPPGDRIYITGNHKALGNWATDTVALEQKSDGSWSKTLLIEKGMLLEFKFTRGSWEMERVRQDGSIPGNSTLYVQTDTSATFVIYNWSDLR